ncbi:MAG: substrate-binding domain-containing protein [Verrucomicrobiae bacterium]|nr:substrate-binding domain-containing protein [Verrucomicrobiae bacterium]NNJ43282.1 substrate-binding domain-containing protein [Akkermansiaceae bacterium]
MGELRILSGSEQAAAYLRTELSRGRWAGTMPGSDRLVRLLGVGRNTVDTALALLEKEGLLESQGVGRARRILRGEQTDTPSLGIHVLAYDRGDLSGNFLATLWNQLQLAGHRVELADKTLEELGMNRQRVARMVQRSGAKNWIVLGGPHEVLHWFSEQELHTLAVSGRHSRLPLASASVDKRQAITDCVERLVALGHSRISLLVREDRRKPHPGQSEQAFLEALQQKGIKTGSYHLPDWGNEVADFYAVLDSLLRYTPPTALLLGGSYLYIAAERHLAQQGIVAPRDISLVSTDYNEEPFYWAEPQISHIQLDWNLAARQIVRWSDRLARGQTDVRQSVTRAKFVEGGTIGPAPS